jgi:hypothetical protein
VGSRDRRLPGAHRIAAIVLLEPALDANYERVKTDTYPWPRTLPFINQGKRDSGIGHE